MPAYARGTTGSVTGLFALTGATHNVKINQWQMVVDAEVSDVSGFGDAGESDFITGKRTYRGSATGFLLSDKDANADGIGNNAIVAGATQTLTLIADSGGKQWSGTNAKILNFRTSSNYNRSGTPCSFQFIFAGAVTEASAA